MVKLSTKKNVAILKRVISGYMQFQKHYTHIYEYNNPNLNPCIYAMWHSDQFCIFGIPEHDKIHVLISKSKDGNIIAYACEGLGFKTIRGSSGKRGAIESTLKMVNILESGENVAIMVDGPNGPLHSIKNGVVRIAKMSGVPIVPVGWYSPQWNFFKLPSWDKMTAPLHNVNLVNLYGEPIYVPKDLPQDKEVEIRKKLKEELEEIGRKLPSVYEEAKKKKVWDAIRTQKKSK